MKRTTLHTIFIGSTPLTVANVVDNTPIGYYVSYNNYDTYEYGSDTTAIVIDKTSAFLILNGDHREQLKGLSLEDACKYFHSNVAQKNKRSDDHEDDVLVEIDGKWQMVRKNKG